MTSVLIIGYGNRLRGDDGIGVEAAEALAKLYNHEPQVQVFALQQLTPELASDMAKTDFVLLLDAEASDIPGIIAKKEIVPQSTRGSFTHQFTPAALLASARTLYGRAPKAISLTLWAKSFELGKAISPSVRGRMKEYLAVAQEIVTGWLKPSESAKDRQSADT